MPETLSPKHSVIRRLGLSSVFSLVIALLSCGQETDYRKVDFTEKIASPPFESAPKARQPLRVAVAAMISPQETLVFYRELIDYLVIGIERDVELIQRKTYGEVNQMLAAGRIDLAFICTGPFVNVGDQSGFTAIATPIVRGDPFYRSYLIVHRDSSLQSLNDLKDKSFAFTDPESNTGFLVPRYWLFEIGATPETYFRKFTYTYSHDNSIMAVAKKLVDAAAVDGHLWEYYQQRHPLYSSQTRVIAKSEPFGSPPLVVSDALSPNLKRILHDRLFSMHQDPQGRRILSELLIDRFAEPQNEWYLPVSRMIDRLRSTGKEGDVPQKP